MKYFAWFLLPLSSSWLIVGCQSERILFLTSVCFKSHKISFMPIAEALAERGHQVTVITPFPASKKHLENLHEITIGGQVNTELGVNWFRMQKQNPITATLGLLTNLRSSAEAGYARLMANEEFQTILHNRSVDLVVVLAVLNDFALPLIDHLQVPYIFFSATINVPWHLKAMGADQMYAHIPGFGSHFKSEMTFTQRMINMIRIEILMAVRQLTLIKPLDQLIAKDFPNAQSIAELEREAQLSIINGKTTITWPRPLPPTVITIGALHVRPAQPLPKDIQEFADRSTDGFIVFTLGSLIPVSSMPSHFQQIFARVFARIPQRIFWKWEKGSIQEKLTDNIMVVDWLPQQDLLGHEKARVFISHGGLLGMQEAAYHGVALLGLPFGNDQRGNLAKAQEDGYALKLEWEELSESNLYEMIQTLLNEPNYASNATRLSRLMRDEIMPGKDIAAYWIEHVLRHGGTNHLRSRAKEMSLFQIYLIDIWIVLLLIPVMSLFITIKLCAWARSYDRSHKIKSN